MEKTFEEMTANEARAHIVARHARGEIDEAEFKKLYAAYCAKMKSEIQQSDKATSAAEAEA